MGRSVAIDVEGSNESATEDPSVGGSGEEEQIGSPALFVLGIQNTCTVQYKTEGRTRKQKILCILSTRNLISCLSFTRFLWSWRIEVNAL